MCDLPPEQVSEQKKLIRGLLEFAHDYDDRSEQVLDQMMCTETCPCYTTVYDFDTNEAGISTTRNDAYYKYTQLSLEAYSYHKRIFSQNTKDYYNLTDEWPLFNWSTDRAKSFESFEECLSHWEDKAAADSSINLKEIFKFEFPDVRDSEKMESYYEYGHDLKHIEQYSHIEDLFECSGMCRPALFYFGRPISEGYPEKTCLAELKEYLDEGAENFASASVGTAFFCLWIFFLHFGLYCRSKEMNNLADGINIPMNNQNQVPVGLEMQIQNTDSNDVEEQEEEPQRRKDNDVDF